MVANIVSFAVAPAANGETDVGRFEFSEFELTSHSREYCEVPESTRNRCAPT
tara:strand:- start:372 stop:527 length:156 start_codon:yes stop_codon:yes gene_type:complete